MRAKEVYRTGLRIEEVGGNCFISTATCALRELGRADWDPDLFFSLFPGLVASNYFMTLVTRCLQEDTGLVYSCRPVRRSVPEVKKALIGVLDAGSLGDLTVKGRDWVGKILGRETARVPENELHALLVFGYYAPKGVEDDLYLYIADPYSEKLWFLPFADIFQILGDDAEVSLGSFFALGGEGNRTSWLPKLSPAHILDGRKIDRSAAAVKAGLIRARSEI